MRNFKPPSRHYHKNWVYSTLFARKRWTRLELIIPLIFTLAIGRAAVRRRPEHILGVYVRVGQPAKKEAAISLNFPWVMRGKTKGIINFGRRKWRKKDIDTERNRWTVGLLTSLGTRGLMSVNLSVWHDADVRPRVRLYPHDTQKRLIFFFFSSPTLCLQNPPTGLNKISWAYFFPLHSLKWGASARRSRFDKSAVAGWKTSTYV